MKKFVDESEILKIKSIVSMGWWFEAHSEFNLPLKNFPFITDDSSVPAQTRKIGDKK